MPFNFKGANEITIEDIENFISGGGAEPPAAEPEENSTIEEDSTANGQQTEKPVTETQAFARRLKEEKEKARNEERESIAKSLGYESYAAMQKSREEDILKESGFDPEEVSPVVEQLVEKRLSEDPRLKELDRYRQERVNTWAQKELKELKELTNGKITKLEDVPKDVLDLWKTKGSLKAAYLELQGEALIREMQTGIASGQNRSTTAHLKSPNGTPAPLTDNKRPLTDKERKVYKMFNPNVTEEELSKMFKDK